MALIKPSYQFEQKILGVHIQGALSNQMFRKTMKFPISRNPVYNTGDLINLLQVDIYQISNYYQNLFQLILIPFQLAVSLFVYIKTLGKNSYSGGVSISIQFIISLIFGLAFGRIQNKYMHSKDIRMRQTDEMLLGIKQIKLNCLEEFFQSRLNKRRDMELKQLRNQSIMLTAIGFLIQFLSSVGVVFTLYFAEGINLELIIIITSNSTSLFQVISAIPDSLKQYIMSQNSLKRYSDFCMQVEIDENLPILDDVESKTAISINQGTFSWMINDQHLEDLTKLERSQISMDKPFVLDQINFQIKKGEFVAFVGNAGSGKTSILRSILGELHIQSENHYYINGKISLSTQDPWILNATVKENITYMQQYDSQRYQQVLDVCGLNKDLQSMAAGDETEIGEKGDNLSGGQQKRINLARSVYKDSDIYIFDDPLSALDIKMRVHIFNNCFVNYLKGKTRILLTNTFANLQNVDRIYILDKGKIVGCGTLWDVMASVQNKGDHNELNSNSLFTESASLEEVIQVQEEQKTDQDFEEKHYNAEQISENHSQFALLHQEDQQVGALSWQVKKTIFYYYGSWFSLFFILLCNGGGIFAAVIGNKKILAIENLPQDKIKEQAMIIYPILALSVTIAITCVQALLLIVGLKTSRKLFRKMLIRLIRGSFTEFYNHILTGRLMNRLTKDLYNIDMLLPSEVQKLSNNSFSLTVFFLSTLLYFNYITMIGMLTFMIIVLYITHLYNLSLREITRIESVSKSPIFSFYQQIIRGILYARTCLKREKILAKHEQNMNVDLSNQICLYGVQQWYQFLTGLITSIFQAGILVFYYFYPGNYGSATFMVVSQMNNFAPILTGITTTLGNLQVYGISFERCLFLANDIPIEDYQINRTQNIRQSITQQIINSRTSSNSRTESAISAISDISFKQSTYQYRPDAKKVLKNLDLTISQGEKIGVVGRTGAGKSSIILALTKIIEQTEGITKIKGTEIGKYSLHQLRSIFSIIPQDPLVFYGTLKENLDPLHKHNLGDLTSVFQLCNMEILKSFKNGLDSIISVSGSNLSMGERQIVCIARCLLESKDIILVDEATANIDKPTENLIKNIFDKYFKNKTVISIAHKITTILNSDRIVVINDGRITECDTPRNLLSDSNSEFANIIRMIKESEKY